MQGLEGRAESQQLGLRHCSDQYGNCYTLCLGCRNLRELDGVKVIQPVDDLHRTGRESRALAIQGLGFRVWGLGFRV